MKKISVVILAAGKGSRMKSDLPKVMHKIAGFEMINWVIDCCGKVNPLNITVVISEDLQQYIPNIKNNSDISFAIQKNRLGTADAVKSALRELENKNSEIGDYVLIAYGDTPLIESSTLQNIINNIDNDDKKAVSIIAFDETNENKYGKVILNDDGNVEKIVEYKDASDDERKVTLCNSGIKIIRSKNIDLIEEIDNLNNSKEYYLTDIVKIARDSGYEVGYVKADKTRLLGVNSKKELANLEKIKQDQLREYFLSNGVTLTDPQSVYFAYDTKIQNDVEIHPNVVFGTNVKIASGCKILPFCHIDGAAIDENVTIGPFARIRPASNISKNVKIGNFVEIKKANIGKSSKINHLSYIGDAKLGENVNVGAGSITCNYDGFNKYQANFGNDCFIGSNSIFIAPVNIDSGSLIAAGSVITKDVGENELAISRAKQQNIKKGATRFKKNKQDN